MAQRRIRPHTDGDGPADAGSADDSRPRAASAQTRRRRTAGDAGLTAAAPAAPFGVETPSGRAEIDLDRPTRRPRGLLALGHGASGSVTAVDLVAVRDAALAAGFAVARITQPYRVQGKRMPPAAPVLDAAWIAAVTSVRADVGARVPLVLGGRSSGARVACRTATALGAVGVLALAFPLHPPGRPESSRAGELDPARPTLVINGSADPFGVPDPVGLVQVEVLPGERHDLRKNPAAVAALAVTWLRTLLD